MSRPWIALTEAYLRRVALFGFPGIVLVLTLPWLFAHMVGLEADWSVSAKNPLGLYMHAVGSVCCLAGLAAWAPLPDFIKGTGLQTLPLSNRSLATFLWLVPGSTVAVTTLVFMCGCELVYSTNWPIVTTVVCATTFCTLCMSCGFWIRDFCLHRLPLGVAAIVGSIVWFTSRFYPDGYRQPLVPWTQFSTLSCAAIGMVLVASWKLQVTAWKRIRCGNTRTPLLLTMGNSEVDAIFNPQDLPPVEAVTTPFHRLVAMEWRRGRASAVLCGAFIAVFAIYIGSMMFIQGKPWRDLIGLVPAIMGLSGFMMGMMVTLDWIGTHKQHGLRPYVAALPFSDRILARSIHWTLARGLTLNILVSLSGLLIPLIAYPLLLGTFDASVLPRRLEAIGPPGLVTVVVASLAMAWAIGGGVATLTATGSRWIYAAAYVLICGIPCAVIILSQFGGPTGEVVAALLQWGIGIAVLVATIACFVRARQRDFITSRTVAICCTAAAALTMAIGMTLTDELLLRFLALCFAALVVISFAALPLAVSWNRHR